MSSVNVSVKKNGFMSKVKSSVNLSVNRLSSSATFWEI